MLVGPAGFSAPADLFQTMGNIYEKEKKSARKTCAPNLASEVLNQGQRSEFVVKMLNRIAEGKKKEKLENKNGALGKQLLEGVGDLQKKCEDNKGKNPDQIERRPDEKEAVATPEPRKKLEVGNDFNHVAVRPDTNQMEASQWIV